MWAGGGLLLSRRGNTAQFEHWNGRKWSVAKSPAVSGASISGMAAVSSTDVCAASANASMLAMYPPRGVSATKAMARARSAARKK